METGMKEDEAIITGMDVNTTWMYAQFTPKQYIGEGTKDNKAVNKPIKKVTQ
tara:strand:+ start:174 stop:329 length:156 start_codon:yes stop_codon:yes gene_type:complete